MTNRFQRCRHPLPPPEERIADATLSVVSLNVARETNPEKILRALHRAPRLREADLFLLQEVAGESGRHNAAAAVARRLGYHDAFVAAAPGVYDQGLAILSRHPISGVQVRPLKHYRLGFRSRDRFALTATIHTPSGSVRLWNAHLDTRINVEDRLAQLQPVIDEAAACKGAQLIGGDLNTNDVYWFRNSVPLPGGPRHGHAVRLAMERHGFQTPFRGPLNTFPVLRRHLDWIFVRNLPALASSVERAAFSDHNAVWARLSLNQAGI